MHRLFIFLIFVLSTIDILSQTKEGYLKFGVTSVSTDTSTVSVENTDLYKGSTIEIYFSKQSSRIDYKMSDLLNISLIIDKKTNNGVQLYSGKMGKFAKIGPANEMGLVSNNNDSTTVILVDETKVIIGYLCKKAIVTSTNYQAIYWYTTKLDFDISELLSFNQAIPGIPLEFSTLTSGVSINYQAKEIGKRIENKKELFEIQIPEGYLEIKDEIEK